VIKSLNEALLCKFDRSDQEEMERRLHSAVADQKQSLIAALASKEDTAKRFALLSKKLKEVTELLTK
jgi:hypothetical protein